MQTVEKNMIAPKLRFGEFFDNWNYKALQEISNITTGSTPSTSNKEFYGGNRLFVSPADISLNRYVHTTKTKVTELGFANGRKICRGSVLFVCIGSTIGKIAQSLDDCITNQQINALNANDDNNNDFLFSLLSHHSSKIKLLAGVQAVPQLNKSEFSRLKFYFPSLPEQQKIAAFLSSVDEKIQQLNKKKSLLEDYKKGVMQKIFSQELRFKDDNGNNYPDWEEKKLGDIGETFNGLTGKTKEDFGTGKPYIQYMQIFNSPKIDVSMFGLVYINDGEKQKKVIKGDVLFTTSSETPMDIGYASVLTEDVDELYLNSFCFGYRPNSLDELFPEFASYLFRSQFFRKDIVKLAQGSTRYNMSKVQLMKVSIQLPSLQEQQKIANFLSSIDEKITLTNIQIDNTKAFKKGLLQQMFV